MFKKNVTNDYSSGELSPKKMQSLERSVNNNDMSNGLPSLQRNMPALPGVQASQSFKGASLLRDGGKSDSATT